MIVITSTQPTLKHAWEARGVRESYMTGSEIYQTKVTFFFLIHILYLFDVYKDKVK